MHEWLFYASAIAAGLTTSEMTRTVLTAMLRGVLMRLQLRIAGKTAAQQDEINQRIKAMIG